MKLIDGVKKHSQKDEASIALNSDEFIFSKYILQSERHKCLLSVPRI